jgi:hypothetical protein
MGFPAPDVWAASVGGFAGTTALRIAEACAARQESRMEGKQIEMASVRSPGDCSSAAAASADTGGEEFLACGDEDGMCIASEPPTRAERRPAQMISADEPEREDEEEGAKASKRARPVAQVMPITGVGTMLPRPHPRFMGRPSPYPCYRPQWIPLGTSNKRPFPPWHAVGRVGLPSIPSGRRLRGPAGGGTEPWRSGRPPARVRAAASITDPLQPFTSSVTPRRQVHHESSIRESETPVHSPREPS